MSDERWARPEAETVEIQTFKAKPGAHMTDAQADRYGRRIQAIATEGVITPEEVVDDAKDAASPLHDWFEWDTKRAAYQYHLVQARELLRGIDVVVEDCRGEPVEIRGFHAVRLGEYEERHYATLPRVMSEEDLRRQVVRAALDELRGWQERYRIYSELMGVNTAIDAAIDGIFDALREKVEE